MTFNCNQLFSSFPPCFFFWQRMICPHYFRQSDSVLTDVIQEPVQTSFVYCAWSHFMAFPKPLKFKGWESSLNRTINKWSTHATPCFLFNKRIFLPGSLSSFSCRLWVLYELTCKCGHEIDIKRIFRASDSALQIISEAFIEFKGKKNGKLGKIYD